MQLFAWNKHGVWAPKKGLKLIIPVIRPENAKDKWEVVEGLIQDYAKLHPKEMRLFMEANAYARVRVKNKFASSDSHSLRWGMNMPPGLDVLIKKYVPEVLETKDNFHTFMRKFPGFRICEVV